MEYTDYQNEIIETMSQKLSSQFSEKELNIIQHELIMTLNEYEIQKRCTDVASHDTSYELFLKTFIATKRVEGLSENTLRRYWYANLEMLSHIGKSIDKITTYDLRFFLSLKRENGVSNRTLSGMRGCYSSFFNWLIEENFISKNPCIGVKQIKYLKEVKKPFTAVEIERIKEACETLRDLTLVEFLYSTGCRVSEITSLNISDIDFVNFECKVVGKGNKERIVYLTPICMMHLSRYLDMRTDSNPALFVGKYGRLTKNGIEKILRIIGKQAGVEDVYPHRFRRTLATNLLDRGMDIQDVAKILGHSDLKTTQVYCYISQNNVKAAFKKYSS